jgi:hypothetical protein
VCGGEKVEIVDNDNWGAWYVACRSFREKLVNERFRICVATTQIRKMLIFRPVQVLKDFEDNAGLPDSRGTLN